MTDENPWDELSSKFALDIDGENYSGASENVLFLWPIILKYLGNVKGKRIIDFGCGAGMLCDHLYQNTAVPIGVDSSEKMLSLAKRRNGNVDYFSQLDDISVPINDVVSIHALEFVRDIEFLVEQISNKIASGGAFIFAVHDPYFLNQFCANNNVYLASETGDDLYNFGQSKIPIFPRTKEFYFNLLKKLNFGSIDVEFPLYSEEFKQDNGMNTAI